MSTTAAAKSAKVVFNPQHQTVDAVHALVTSILGKAGCRACGRLINLEFQFQGDPDPDALKAGALSVVTEGF